MRLAGEEGPEVDAPVGAGFSCTSNGGGLSGETAEDIGQFADRARVLRAELALESTEDDGVPD